MLDSQCQIFVLVEAGMAGAGFVAGFWLCWLRIPLDDGLSHARSVPVNQDPFGVRFVWLLPGLWSGWRAYFYGEFDPGSGRTLAACLTHASRTVKPFGVDQWRTGE